MTRKNLKKSIAILRQHLEDFGECDDTVLLLDICDAVDELLMPNGGELVYLKSEDERR